MVGGHPVDLRVRVLPTIFGESVVMRVLDRSVVNLSLRDVGGAVGQAADHEHAAVVQQGRRVKTASGVQGGGGLEASGQGRVDVDGARDTDGTFATQIHRRRSGHPA